MITLGCDLHREPADRRTTDEHSSADRENPYDSVFRSTMRAFHRLRAELAVYIVSAIALSTFTRDVVITSLPRLSFIIKHYYLLEGGDVAYLALDSQANRQPANL